MQQEIVYEDTNTNQEIIDDPYSQGANYSEISQVIQQLFEMGNISAITDLSIDEVKLATRIWAIAEMKNIQLYKKVLIKFFELKLSSNRKSRREILDAIKGHSPRPSFGQRIGSFFNRR